MSDMELIVIIGLMGSYEVGKKLSAMTSRRGSSQDNPPSMLKKSVNSQKSVSVATNRHQAFSAHFNVSVFPLNEPGTVQRFEEDYIPAEGNVQLTDKHKA